jgi:hypothetical protein
MIVDFTPDMYDIPGSDYEAYGDYLDAMDSVTGNIRPAREMINLSLMRAGDIFSPDIYHAGLSVSGMVIPKTDLYVQIDGRYSMVAHSAIQQIGEAMIGIGVSVRSGESSKLHRIIERESLPYLDYLTDLSETQRLENEVTTMPLHVTLCNTVYVHQDDLLVPVNTSGITDLMNRLSFFTDHTTIQHAVIDLMGGLAPNAISAVYGGPHSGTEIFTKNVPELIGFSNGYVDAELVAALIHLYTIERLLEQGYGEELQTLQLQTQHRINAFERNLPESNDRSDKVRSYAQFLFGMFGKVLDKSDPFMRDLSDFYSLENDVFNDFLHACANTDKELRIRSGIIPIRELPIRIYNRLDARYFEPI